MSSRNLLVVAMLILGSRVAYGQVSGNVGYARVGGKAQAEQQERAKRVLTEHELPPPGATYVEANVLMNVPADEYVAVFAVAQEGVTVAECHQKMDAALQGFSAAVKKLGVGDDAFLIDFIAQNPIYGFELIEDIAREKRVGFELKKNVSIRYRDPALLDRLVLAAAEWQIFDLVKVDYVVHDVNAVNEQLVEEAARVLKQKAARYEKLLGLKLDGPARVLAERPAAYYPAELYDSYTAAESEVMENAHFRQKYTTQSARKSRTFYFNPLDADRFDQVLNPVVTQPVVQFTLYLKVQYGGAASK